MSHIHSRAATPCLARTIRVGGIVVFRSYNWRSYLRTYSWMDTHPIAHTHWQVDLRFQQVRSFLECDEDAFFSAVGEITSAGRSHNNQRGIQQKIILIKERGICTSGWWPDSCVQPTLPWHFFFFCNKIILLIVYHLYKQNCT